MRHVLVLGGSQGARFVNAIVLEAAKECSHLSFTVATGPALIEEARAKSGDAQNVRLVPYLSGSELIDAYVNADLFIGRSGGTLAEVAKFRLPSVLIPLPTSADHHQLFNAAEFESDGAARVLWQGGVSPIGHGGATAATLIEAIRSWDAESETQAAAALEAWDVPDATDRIRSFIIKN
jgi:UDP-N-acetylglucosamine--N-acetylmuramyl-(pentapeptide) pyrophosphoryl-undecaprenol N-acetylglucosamine transferase